MAKSLLIRQKEERTKYCNLCYGCMHDCKKVESINKCDFFKQGLSKSEYKKLIQEQNINLKKLCNKEGISLNILMKMLNGKLNFTYKYRTILNSRIYEKEEYLPYIQKFEKDVKSN